MRAITKINGFAVLISHCDITTPGHYDTWLNYSTLGFIAQIVKKSQKPFFDHHNADNASFTMVNEWFL